MDPAGVGDHVLHTQGSVDLIRRDSQLGHAGSGHLHEDGFLLGSPEGDLGHVLNQQELSLEHFPHIDQLSQRITFAVNGQEDAKHVTEVVVDDRGTCSRG